VAVEAGELLEGHADVAGEAVELVDDHHVEPARLGVAQHRGEGGALVHAVGAGRLALLGYSATTAQPRDWQNRAAPAAARRGRSRRPAPRCSPGSRSPPAWPSPPARQCRRHPPPTSRDRPLDGRAELVDLGRLQPSAAAILRMLAKRGTCRPVSAKWTVFTATPARCASACSSAGA
jgi:hypothetical protein